MNAGLLVYTSGIVSFARFYVVCFVCFEFVSCFQNIVGPLYPGHYVITPHHSDGNEHYLGELISSANMS